MLTVSEEVLSQLLKKYDGRLLQQSQTSSYQQFSLNFYTNTQLVTDNRVQIAMDLDITKAFDSYLKNYRNLPEVTFGAYVKWITCKAMLNTPFNWRYINGQWFEFHNLPLEVSVVTTDERQQVLYYLDNVNHSQWELFSQRHKELSSATLPDALELIKKLPLYGIAQQVVGVKIERMTQYNTTRKVSSEHQPWIIYGLAYPQGGRVYLPLSISFSHSALTPQLLAEFLQKWSRYAEMTPKEVEEHSQKLFAERNGKPSFAIHYTPGYKAHSTLTKKEDEVRELQSAFTPQAKL